MSPALRKLTGNIKRSNTLVVFIINPLKIGVMFGNPEPLPGGNALKFYAPCGFNSPHRLHQVR